LEIFPVRVDIRTKALPDTSRICSNHLRLALGEEQGQSRVHHCCERSMSGRKGDWSKGLTASASPGSHGPLTSNPHRCLKPAVGDPASAGELD